MKKQLILSAEQLLAIGFVKKIHPATMATDEQPYPDKEKITYEIPILNGIFYFNEGEKRYVWYCKMIIGNASNHINLDITHKANLFTVLSAFGVKFNLLITE